MQSLLNTIIIDRGISQENEYFLANTINFWTLLCLSIAHVTNCYVLIITLLLAPS